ncbi:MAG: CHRD domain-containing protein [Chloroflexi bacterium]|nr:CHRD domain-containing protein [Chloroflexota bacterium]
MISRTAASDEFRADLKGADEVPPVDSNATGRVQLKVAGDESMITFEMEVSGITDMTQSHIHLAPAGVNGPIVAWLVPAKPPLTLVRGELDLKLANGTIAAADLVGPMAGKTVGDLVAEMRAGNTYANVHTVAHPPGEIRGQIMSR